MEGQMAREGLEQRGEGRSVIEMMCVGRVDRGERKDVKEGKDMQRRDVGEGEIDSVCLVLAYLKNTAGTKAHKHCGERRKR